MSLDAQITAAQAKADAAHCRKDTRGWHSALDELKALKVRRMRRDKRKGLFREISSVATLAAYFIAGYVWLNPLDAMAAEVTPWNTQAISNAWGAILLGFMFVSGLAVVFLTRLFAINPREDDDGMFPDPDKPRKTPEDAWRKAYAESDGDHASYVKWRQK